MRGVAVPPWEPVDCHRSTFEFLQGSVSITRPRIKIGRQRLLRTLHAKSAKSMMAKETSSCGIPAIPRCVSLDRCADAEAGAMKWGSSCESCSHNDSRHGAELAIRFWNARHGGT